MSPSTSPCHLVTLSSRHASLRRRAFTLIELLLVLVILAVLAGVAVPMYTGYGKKAKVDGTKASISNVETALQAFETQYQRFPDNLDELMKPPVAPDGSQPSRFLKGDTVPLDGWGNAFNYRSPGTVNADTYDLWSSGPNGIDEGGAGDDLTAWTKSN